MNLVREVSLDKRHRRYVFRYRAGCEADIVAAMASLAAAAEHDFDWVDAAVLAYQMGRRLEMDLDHIGTYAASKTHAGPRSHDGETAQPLHKVVAKGR